MVPSAASAAAVGCGFATRPAPAPPTGRTGAAQPGVASRAKTYPVRLLAWGEAPTPAGLQAAARDFNEAHLDVRLEIETRLATLPRDAFFDQLLASVADGTAPDLVHAQGWTWQPYAVQGFLQPLDELATRDNWSAAWPKAEAHDLQTRFRGKRYLCPTGCSTFVLWHAPARFYEAGLQPPRADWTYADFQEAAIKLTRRARDRQVYGYRWNGGYLMNFPWWRLANQQEWDRVADPRRAYWNTAAVIEAFQFQLFDSQYRLRIAPTTQAIAADPDAYRLETGAVAMQVRSVDALAAVEDTGRRHGATHLDVQVLPRGRASRTPHLNLIDGLVLTRASKDKEAAWEALKWLGSDAGQMRVAEQGRLCNTPAAARRFWLPLAKQRFAVPNVEAFVKAMDDASIHLAGEIDEPALNRDAGLDAALAAIRDGALTAKQALDLVQPRLQRVLDSYWQAQAQPG